ncbi:MAG: hypothetical protein J07AB43_10710 [Candidatus Nanosalina sp. J07AB43]|nr:MAG: hypothetical protein J07AB43_10710 [Candidatus Nanosalina sp. J07AB43]
MSLIGVKAERKIVDTAVICVCVISAYFGGILAAMSLGATATALSLPIIFIISMGFIHLVLRRGRELDREEHDNKYELLKSFAFLTMSFLAYNIGTASGENIIPTASLPAYLTAAAVSFNIYLMGYRANS